MVKYSIRPVVILPFVLLGVFGASEVLSPRAYAAGLIALDLDDDTDVDGGDFALFRECLSGSNVSHDGSPTCQEADIDYDGDVDMADFGIMQKCFSGVGVPGNPACACVRPKTNLAIGAAPNPVYSGQGTYVTVALSQVGVDYQLRNHADNTPIGSPVAGTGGTIYLPSDTLTSAKTFNVLAVNTPAGCSVQLNATVTVTVTPYTPRNKIGVHVVCGSRNGYGPFIQNCAAAGKPVAVVKIVDDWGAATEPYQYSPDTLIVGRKISTPNYNLEGFNEYVGQDPAQFAQTIFNEVRPYWAAQPKIDVWEICNEWDSHYAWQADFYIAMMDLAEAAGYRIALFSSSVGTPDEDAWPDVARACARAKAHGNHMLALHEYALWTDLLQASYATYGDALVLRYRRLYNYLAPRNADCPLVLTEVGQGGGGSFVGTDLFVQDFGWYDTEMRKDPYVVGCAAWLLGNCGWGAANFQDALPALTNYIIAH